MPYVSVIVPCYNEQETISLLLNAIYTQSYPRADMEVIVADGLSKDQTRSRITAFQQAHPGLTIQVVDNPLRIIPSALNRAIEAARGEVIVRLDAHSIPATNYIERCVADLQVGHGENVGGVWHIQPGSDTWIARAIAVAAAHPLGAGDAQYRRGGNARAVDTVPFGAFRRDLIDKIGVFDENLLTNEDYEFNTRIRQAGGVIYFDPEISSVYFARPNLVALARQYLRYGYWKAQMLRRYPKTMRWRQILPPVFVAGLVILALLFPWVVIARWLLLLQISIYGLTLISAGIIQSVKVKDPSLVIGFPIAIATMHLSWGGALLWGILFPPTSSHTQGNC